MKPGLVMLNRPFSFGEGIRGMRPEAIKAHQSFSELPIIIGHLENVE